MDFCNGHTGIPYTQVRRVTRLIADVADHNGDWMLRRRILMEGLRDLLDADGWIWSAKQYGSEDGGPVHSDLLYDGLDEAQIKGWINGRGSHVRPPEEDPLAALAMQGEHFTQTRQQLVPDETWYGDPFVRQCRLDKGIDHFLCAFYPIALRHFSVITLFRRVGRHPFGQTERCLCHLAIDATESFHRSVFEDCEPKDWNGLTPRQRSVLVHLLYGRSREEIAQALHISPDTVKSHIHSVYRYFGVESQVKLMQYYYCGAASVGDMDGI